MLHTALATHANQPRQQHKGENQHRPNQLTALRKVAKKILPATVADSHSSTIHTKTRLPRKLKQIHKRTQPRVKCKITCTRICSLKNLLNVT
jgi:hypothetical protein